MSGSTRPAAGWSLIPAVSRLLFLRRACGNPAVMSYRTERVAGPALSDTLAYTLLVGLVPAVTVQLTARRVPRQTLVSRRHR